MVHDIPYVQKLDRVTGHISVVALSMYFIALQVYAGEELQSKDLHLIFKVSDFICDGKTPDNDHLRVRFAEGYDSPTTHY